VAPARRQGEAVLRFADFELDQRRAELRGPDGAPIRLRPKTFLMLHTLAANAGRVVGKQELMDTVWADIHVSEDSLFQCIREIRTALGDDDRSLVKVVSGRGYLFDVEVSGEPRLPSRDVAGAPTPPPVVVDDVAPGPAAASFRVPRRRFWIASAVLVVIALCAAILLPRHLGEAARPAIAVMPIVVNGGGMQAGVTAAGVADRLVEGLSTIETIRVLAPTPQGAARTADADYLLAGELQGNGEGWTLAARLIRAGTTEVAAVAGATLENEGDESLRQTRLAAGVGGTLARSLNVMMEGGPASPRSGAARVAIEQAMASINQTSPERFAAAQQMLERALAADPGNVDLQVTLAGLQTRGIQMLWFDPATSAAAETRARTLLEGALETSPRSIAVLEAYCRFLAATNNFVESLVACARVLSFDPWNGSALYQLGLTQLHLGRFEDALASFRQAYRFDTPSVSRWTWLLGIGWANLLLGNDAEAAQWIERSIAITPASGRSHLLLAVAYQRLGRFEDARAAMARALELRPGSNSVNVSSPTRNASPVFLEVVETLRRAMIAAGLPEG
jgi:DNA-binding winged helix-turn-helix (wHTH) protein/tetratricopeptide (TPR) repeat protein